MTYSQLKKHECEGAAFSGIVDIPVEHIYDLTADNKRTVIAHGYDGKFYRIVESTTDDFLQRNKDRRGLDRTVSSAGLAEF